MEKNVSIEPQATDTALSMTAQMSSVQQDHISGSVESVKHTAKTNLGQQVLAGSAVSVDRGVGDTQNPRGGWF